MIRILIVAVGLLIGVQAAAAQNLDVIKERKQTMKQAGGAAGSAGKMLKGEAPFDLASVQASLKTLVDVAAKMPGLFPVDSKTGGETKALPAIWDNKADVDARYAKLGQDATNALASIKDQASFAAAMPPIFKNCGGCHEKYRTSEN
jgi:cytochrome c556